MTCRGLCVFVIYAVNKGSLEKNEFCDLICSCVDYNDLPVLTRTTQVQIGIA